MGDERVMADNDSKRYYWLRLKKDFFQQHQIKVLKALPNGRLYALIYLELLAESTSHEGELRYSKMLPYDTVTLASVIDEDKDNLEKAIETLIKLELVEVLEDGTIYLREIQRLIGSETGSAQRKREYRERLNTIEKQPEISFGTIGGQCLLENRDKSKEIRDKSIDINYIAPSSNESEAVAKLPLNENGTFHYVLPTDVEHYKELYPGVDVEQELRNMTGWLEANRERRKTKRGVQKFINNWLSKAQNRAKGSPQKKGDLFYFDVD